MEMYNRSLRTSTPSPPYAHPTLSTLLQEHVAAGKFSENVKKYQRNKTTQKNMCSVVVNLIVNLVLPCKI